MRALLYTCILFSLFLISCNDVTDKPNDHITYKTDTTSNLENVIRKQEDTVFIRHDSEWTSEKVVYVTDTIIFGSGMHRNILTGSTILPNTHNQYSLYWEYGLTFNKISKSDCQKSAEEFYEMGGTIQDKINFVITTDSTIIIDINIFDNCCYDFLCDVSIVDGSIINLMFTGYGTHCDCDCCYGLTYHLIKEKDPAYKKMRSVMINGNRKTIKNIKE